MSHSATLSAGFETLERFLADWDLPDAASRSAQRQASTLEELRSFYDAMLPLGEKALEYLRQFELGAVPPEGERLLALMLSLAEIAPAVEWYGGPEVRNGFPVDRIRYLRQIPDTAPQRWRREESQRGAGQGPRLAHRSHAEVPRNRHGTRLDARLPRSRLPREGDRGDLRAQLAPDRPRRAAARAGPLLRPRHADLRAVGPRVPRSERRGARLSQRLLASRQRRGAP